MLKSNETTSNKKRNKISAKRKIERSSKKERGKQSSGEGMVKKQI